MMTFDVHFRDVQWLLRDLEGLPKECRGAMWQAVKRTLTTLRKDLAKNIAEESYLEKNRITKAITPVQMYGSKTAGRSKTTDAGHIMGWIRVSSKQLPLDAFKIIPNRPTFPKGRHRKDGMLSGYKLGPRQPVGYRERGTYRSAGFVIRGGKSGQLRFMVELLGKRHRFDGKVRPVLARASGYSVQYFAFFDNVYQDIEKRAKRRFVDVLNHEIQFRLDGLGKGK